MRYIKWLWPLIRIKKWWLLLGLALMAVETLAAYAGISIQQRLIDDVLIRGFYSKLPFYLLLMGVFLLSTPGLFTLIAMICHSAGYQLRVILAGKIMAHYYRLPAHVFLKERMSRFVDYLEKDIYDVCESVSYLIPRGLQQLFGVICLMALIGWINPILLLFSVVFGLFYVGLGRYFSLRVQGAGREVRERNTELLIHLEEGVSATREVVAFHRMDWEHRRYTQLFGRYFDAVLREGKLANRQIFLSDPLKWCGNLLLLFYGGYLVIQGGLSAGEFVVLYQFNSRLVDGFQQVFSSYMMFARSKAGVDRLRTITDEEVEQDGTMKITGAISSLVFENVNFTYPKQTSPVLQQFDICIPIGCKVAFVGLSGGGKSTVSKLLMRLYEPDSGRIAVNGMDLRELSRRMWSGRIAITFQEPYMFPDTIRNNLIFGRQGISEEQMIGVCRRMQIHEMIAGLPNGYDTVLGERGVTISGGERQRLALARAVLGDPEILILDEATSALDLETERLVQMNLDELRVGRTTIIIAHRLSTIQNADMIFVMQDGRLAESGNHETLLAYGHLYRDLVHSSFESKVS
ncbi:ABC transporter ATP-binding protein [Paenibacillus roseipurpureus]|uniref:ABC transporter ATP-binding protein n=1 Tax=Paenibacillus roseopurpureus TaxID=2918901 RepID=A0AA96RLC6_9BACL|nr:ABC transporter ATP-binding protein [Paenibacillus sp. MBLB1832]WNR45274.1 ABC transporter ATP-binding protein [Paenibacillus sp. MBLB1832]